MGVHSRGNITGGLLALSLILSGCLTDEKKVAAKITSQPESRVVSPDSLASFGVVATGSGTLEYQWMMGNVNLTGQTRDTLKIANTYHDSIFKCIVKNGVGVDTSIFVTFYLDWKPVSGLSVAAQGNAAPGSAIDFDVPAPDVPEALTTDIAQANQGVIDLMFVYSGGALKLMSPVAARDARDVSNAVNGYTGVKDVHFVRVSEKPLNQELGVEVYNAGSAINTAVVAEGDQFIVKTTENKYMYFKVGPILGNGVTASTNLAISVGTL